MICRKIFFPLHGGKGIEEELRDVGESNGVAACDALAAELFDEMAEEAIHGVRAGEVLNSSKKVSGNGFRIGSGNTYVAAIRVIGAKRRVSISIRGSGVRVEEHVATAAFGTDMLAVGNGLRFGRHGRSSLRLKLENGKPKVEE